MDCSPPDSSVHGISKARILKWIAISFSRWSSHPGIKPVFCIGRQILYRWATRKVLPFLGTKILSGSLRNSLSVPILEHTWPGSYWKASWIVSSLVLLKTIFSYGILPSESVEEEVPDAEVHASSFWHWTPRLYFCFICAHCLSSMAVSPWLTLLFAGLSPSTASSAPFLKCSVPPPVVTLAAILSPRGPYRHAELLFSKAMLFTSRCCSATGLAECPFQLQISFYFFLQISFSPWVFRYFCQ